MNVGRAFPTHAMPSVCGSCHTSAAAQGAGHWECVAELCKVPAHVTFNILWFLPVERRVCCGSCEAGDAFRSWAEYNKKKLGNMSVVLGNAGSFGLGNFQQLGPIDFHSRKLGRY